MKTDLNKYMVYHHKTSIVPTNGTWSYSVILSLIILNQHSAYIQVQYRVYTVYVLRVSWSMQMMFVL